MDIISMAYAKKLVNGLQSGLDNASVDNNTCSITFQWKNGTSSTMTFPKPLDGANGVGISDVKLKEVTAGSGKETHLICTLEDGTEIDAGNIPGGSAGTTNYDDTQIKKDIADLQADKQDKTDNTLNTTDKTVVGAINEINGNALDNVAFSSDYKNIIINRKSGLNPYAIPISAIIHNAKITELNDVDDTNIGNGKTLVYDSAIQKHKYVDSTRTDELVKMDSTTDAKHLSDLIDKSTIINDNGILKVKKLDGQDVTITEINHLKGLTMNIMDLVNAFANGGVKVLNTPVNTHADLSTLDRSTFLDGISYIVYVLADETHSGAKTTYLCDKTSETFFGNADSQRNFITNPIDLANEVTGKLGAGNIDVDSLWSLLTINDTYKTLTTKNEPFGTHGAKALYDELVADIGKKANATDLTTHTSDTNIHITTAERTKWNAVDDKIEALKSTQNLEYEGESKICNNTLASRTSDMFIKGKTYQNLFRRINSQTTQEQDNNYILTGVANAYSMLSIYPTYNLQKNNKYTFVIDVKNLNVPDGRPFKFDGFNGNTWVCGTKIETTGLKKIILQGNQDITEIRLQINNGINCNITVSKNIIILKGDWTNKEVPTSITGIESTGQKENKISILSKNNKSTDYKEDKKEILLPVEGGLKSLPNGIADTIEQRSDGVYLVQRVKKETYVNGDENNNNYLTDKVNTYKPLAAPVETKLDIQNIDLEVYKDTTYITTDNAIKPTLSFKVPSNIGGVIQSNSQNINKLYKLSDEVDNKVDKTDITTTINSSSTDSQVPSANYIYNKFIIDNIKDICVNTTKGNKSLSKYGVDDISNLTSLLSLTSKLNPITNTRYTIQIIESIKQTFCDCGLTPVPESGLLVITTQNMSGKAIFTTDSGLIYVTTTSASKYNEWAKWKKVCTTTASDVGTTNIKFTYNTNYEVVNDNCKYIIKNGICTMFLYIKCKTPANAWKTVSNVPKASILNICSTISSLNGDGFLRCSVNTTGDLSFANGTAGTSYLGTITYQVAES